MSRRTTALLTLAVLLLLALVGFYLYLSGGTRSSDSVASRTASGVVPVRQIYMAGGENMRRPTGVAVARNGSFYVTLKEDARVIAFDRAGDRISGWGNRGLKQGELMSPLGIAVDSMAGQAYVVDRSRMRLCCFDLEGRFQWERPVLEPVAVALAGSDVVVATFGPLVHLTAEGQIVSETGQRGHRRGEFDFPRSLALVPGTSDVVVADSNNARVQRVALLGESTATVRWVVGTPPRVQDDPKTLFGVPSGVTVDNRGRVWVLDGFRAQIVVLDARTGRKLHTFEKLDGSAPGQFHLPTGISFLGGDSFVITDTYNDRVQIVRLLVPGDDNLVRRRPWIAWLLALPVLLLLIPWLKRKVYVSRGALEDAREKGVLRLMAAAFRQLHALPEVVAEFAEVEEDGIRIGDYLVAVREPGKDKTKEEIQRLEASISATWSARVLSPRRLLLISGEEMDVDLAEPLIPLARTVEWVIENFALPGEDTAGEGVDSSGTDES